MKTRTLYILKSKKDYTKLKTKELKMKSNYMVVTKNGRYEFSSRLEAESLYSYIKRSYLVQKLDYGYVVIHSSKVELFNNYYSLMTYITGN
jgi:hypothetical protein